MDNAVRSTHWWKVIPDVMRSCCGHTNLVDDINVQACACDLLYYTITQFSFFAVLERWYINDCETECTFVYLICVQNTKLLITKL